MIEQGLMKPSAQVVNVGGSTNAKDDSHDRDIKQDGRSRDGSVFLRDGIVENFVARRQRQQKTQPVIADSNKNDREDISRENEIVLEGMTVEQIKEMQEELNEALTPETIAWFRKKKQPR